VSKKLIYTVCVFLIGSCSLFTEKDHDKLEQPLARVYDQYLYISDVTSIIKRGTNPEDSLELLRNYVESWIRKKIVLNYAERNPNIEQEEIQQKIESYKEALISYYYEKELVRQKLDTLIKDDEIKKYFAQYERNFELKEDILRMIFVKVKPETPKLDSLRLWIKSFDDLEKQKLENYCFQYAINFNLNDSLWFLYRDIRKEIPMNDQNSNHISTSNSLLEFSDTSNLYLMVVKEYLRKGNIPPMSFVMDDIRKIVVNKRKLKLINETYDRMYEEGQKKKHFEIFIDDESGKLSE